MQDLEPHIEEETGTVKRKTQRFFIAIIVVASLAFIVGIVSMIMDESEEKSKIEEAQKTKVAIKEKASNIAEPEFKEVTKFEDAVTAQQLRKERELANESKRDSLKAARESAQARKKAFEPLQSNITTNDNLGEEFEEMTPYDQFKNEIIETRKVRSLTEIQELASSEVRLSKALEDFEVKEKQRALSARQGKFSIKKISSNNRLVNIPQNTTNKVRSSRDRLKEVREKSAAAEKLKAKLLAGDFNSENNYAGLNEQLRNLETPADMPRFSNVETQNKRVVGATKDKAAALNIKNGVKLPTGTVIKAVLMNTIISDYSNTPYKAQITQDIYDADYETILFPKGTIIDGRSVSISNINEPIQARTGLVVNWFVLPNGNRIDFNKSAAALDSMGIGAVKDEVDYHLMAQFLGVSAYALISTSSESNVSSAFTGQTDIGGDIESSFRNQLAPLASRYLSLVPTITLHTGKPISIYIENEMIVQPWGTIYDNLY